VSQLYGEPQDPTAIFQVSNAQRCGIGQRDEELAFVHNVAIILRRATIIKKRKSRPRQRGFALIARDETDLEALTAELARVVQETMQPESVNLWLRQTGKGS